MNRENKLAIIVGFSLVLVVAVLLSDHFSRARTAKVGGDIAPATARDVGAGAAGLLKPIGPPEEIPVAHRPLGETTPVAHTVPESPGADRPTPDMFSMDPGIPLEDHAAHGAGQPSPSKDSPEVAEMDGGPSHDVPYSEGDMQSYEVKPGDSLYAIAKKFYNDGTLSRQLAEFNKAKVPNAATVRAGVTLQIPPKDVLLGNAVIDPTGAAKKRAPAPPAQKAVPPRGPADRAIAKADADRKDKYATYTVHKGDALSTIAQKLLGSSRRADEIYRLNRDVLEDEHTVLAGMVLKVPSR